MVYVGGTTESPKGNESAVVVSSSARSTENASSALPPHMIFVGKNGGNESEVDIEGDPSHQENLVIEEPNHIITFQRNNTDKKLPGHMVFNESIRIVDKPVSTLTKGNGKCDRDA